MRRWDAGSEEHIGSDDQAAANRIPQYHNGDEDHGQGVETHFEIRTYGLSRFLTIHIVRSHAP